MDDYISISMLNDFIFCPYSIYLHGMYMEADESIYHASPQVRGKVAHKAIDTRTYSTRKEDIMSMSVCSERLRIIGKIDLYRRDKKMLVERKFRLKQIYQGQLYQLWAQYACLQEMGYEVEKMAFYETSTNKTIPVELPKEQDIRNLEIFIARFREFRPESQTTINPNKCIHCIYCSICDKTDTDNVYT